MKLRQFLKNEDGASTFVEASIVFPIVFLIVLFLFIMGYYQLEVATLQTRADRVANITSRMIAEPAYKYLADDISSKRIDFDSMPEINDNKIKEIYENLDPYRYWGSGERALSNDLIDEVGKIVTTQAYINASNSEKSVTITPSKSGLSNKVVVTVTNGVKLPNFLKLLGLPTKVDTQISSVAYVSDSSEFMRNTDLVFDFTEFLCEKVGLSDNLNDIINKMKKQFEFLGK